jgi:hypothetical protein
MHLFLRCGRRFLRIPGNFLRPDQRDRAGKQGE